MVVRLHAEAYVDLVIMSMARASLLLLVDVDKFPGSTRLLLPFLALIDPLFKIELRKLEIVSLCTLLLQ